ncbi:MAG: DNA-binding response regulator [Desulfobacteraceae bacterium]|nr:MAG: DNA-binding response regulator [Desulfobacteraceae bacterium]
MTSINILVAEDDPHIRMGLVDTLESEGYTVFEAADGKEALQVFDTRQVHLVLLDVMMPHISGYDVCRSIRTKDSRMPVIMLTAKGEEIDKVVGLQLGADDYMTKPFGVHELLARITAVLRRCGPASKSPADTGDARITFAGMSVDLKRYKLVRDGEETDLSDREVKLLKLFHEHPEEVLSRDVILNRVWGIEYLGTTRTLDQHIAILRKKLEIDPAQPKIIVTVHGIGYRYQP